MNTRAQVFFTRDALSISRRRFLHVTVAVSGALVALPRSGLAAPTALLAAEPKAAQPVISFHMDQPYVDYSGTAQPYVPPSGARSAHAIAELNDEAVFATLRL